MDTIVSYCFPFCDQVSDRKQLKERRADLGYSLESIVVKKDGGRHDPAGHTASSEVG